MGLPCPKIGLHSFCEAPISFCPRDMSQIVEKYRIFNCNIEEYFEKFLDPQPDADDFQHSVSSYLFTDASLVKLSRRSVQ